LEFELRVSVLAKLESPSQLFFRFTFQTGSPISASDSGPHICATPWDHKLRT
jgi:hypothetical protein